MTKRSVSARIFILICAGLMAASVLLTGCVRKDEPELFRYQGNFLGVFDTVTTVVGYAPDEETFQNYMRQLREELEEYHQLYDIYHEYDGIANLKTVNDNAGLQPVVVDQRIIDLLTEAIKIHEKTGGTMNVAMGSVLALWHDARTEGIDDPQHAALPSREQLEAADQHTDIHNLIIDREASTVYLADPKMSLDVGAIGKGYATEMVCRSLQQQGFTHALVNVGGNTRAIGTKPDGSCWNVAIQNPDTDSGTAYLHIAELADQALVHSGTYQRYYTVDGRQYHHIIHPDLLMPWDIYTQVSILCNDSGMADALSTSVFNMELEEGLTFIENLDNTEAMWVLSDGTEVFSSGFKKAIKK